ncbi:MAG: four helix bundle protein [Deltaproteobacteria bacterium]|nr:four helix bundle protein [Deltaproteobacteria bacterium]MBI3391495.1 four helix bundle protein [Deltaproteobacteria bacterium]
MDKPHKRLEVWQMSVHLVVEVYRLTSAYPDAERYGLISQMRRAAVSVASNIAEGAARQTKKEFANFVHIARGSLSELDTQVEISRRLGYLASQAIPLLEDMMQRIDQMLAGLLRKLRATISSNVSRLPSNV